MIKKAITLVNIAILIMKASHGQYFNPDSIKNHIIQISNSAKLSNPEKLALLLNYGDQIKNTPYSNDSTGTFLLRFIGFAYSEQDDYLNAVKYFREAIHIITLNSDKPSVKQKDLIAAYFWLSTFYDALNNNTEKRKTIDSCIYYADFLKSVSDIYLVRALSDRVQYFFDIGEYKLCIDDAIRCENLADAYAKTISDPLYKERTLDIAKISFGWHINALLELDKFTEAQNLLTNKLEEYKRTRATAYIGLTYSQLARVEEEKGDYEKDLFFFKKAFEIYRRVGYQFNCKQILNNIGEIYFRYLHDGDRALAYLQDALRYKNNDKTLNQADSVETLNIYGRMANVYVQKGIYDSAFFYFQQALNQVKIGISETDILNSPLDKFINLKKINYLTSLIIDKGDAFRKNYEATRQLKSLTEALKIYTVADKLLARVNIIQFDLETKLFWRKETRRLYENAIQACYLHKDANKAFYFFERSRAVLLNIQLAQQNWLGNEDISRLVEIKKKISRLDLERKSIVENSKEDGVIRDSLLIRSQELYRLEQLIKVNNPLYYQNVDTTIITPAEVRKNLLKDHQALLEIFSGDSGIYSILITAGQIFINKINKSDFDQSAKLYVTYISNPQLLNSDFSGFKMVSHHLYQLIFQNNPTPQGRIIISPEGRYFPFESLVTENSSKNPVYFLLDHAVSYTYSARYLLNDFNSDKKTESNNFFGLAPVRYAPGFQLAILPGSDVSLRNISSLFTSFNNLIGKNASRNNFLQNFPTYSIVQLYTHASDSSENKEPVIYFADSVLYLSELIPGKKPITRLIVLSACETGNGNLYQGEGVFSFNRGFAALGISSCISNLWPAENISTYKITELFYKYLADGSPLDLALQRAKLEYIQKNTGEKSLPYYWASAVMVGKTDAIFHSNPYPRIIILFFIMISGIIFWKLRAKKHPIPEAGG